MSKIKSISYCAMCRLFKILILLVISGKINDSLSAPLAPSCGIGTSWAKYYGLVTSLGRQKRNIYKYSFYCRLQSHFPPTLYTPGYKGPKKEKKIPKVCRINYKSTYLRSETEALTLRKYYLTVALPQLKAQYRDGIAKSLVLSKRIGELKITIEKTKKIYRLVRAREILSRVFLKKANLDKMENTQYTTNVIRFLRSRIVYLSEKQREILSNLLSYLKEIRKSKKKKRKKLIVDLKNIIKSSDNMLKGLRKVLLELKKTKSRLLRIRFRENRRAHMSAQCHKNLIKNILSLEVYFRKLKIPLRPPIKKNHQSLSVNSAKRASK